MIISQPLIFVHDHNTRQHTNLYVSRTKTTFGENMIKNKGALLWNQLTQEIQSSKSLYVFKKATWKSLVAKYNQQ